VGRTTGWPVSRPRVMTAAGVLLIAGAVLSLVQAGLLLHEAPHGQSSYSHGPWPGPEPLGVMGVVAAGVLAVLAVALVVSTALCLRGRIGGWYASFVTGLLVLIAACGCGGRAGIGGAFGSSATDDWENLDPDNNFDLPLATSVLRVAAALAVATLVAVLVALILLLYKRFRHRLG
jgi:hypothetical protein